MTFKKLTTAIVTSGALLVLASGAAFASVDVNVSGNGADSVNSVKVSQWNSNSVNQSNVLKVNNSLVSSANTGGNSVSKTTGGSALVDTGNATSNVAVLVTGGNNTAHLQNCGCEEDVNVIVQDNGADSTNKVKVKGGSHSSQNQYSKTKVNTYGKSYANTGKNSVKKTTNGDSEVKTGESESAVSVIVSGGANTLE